MIRCDGCGAYFFTQARGDEYDSFCISYVPADVSSQEQVIFFATVSLSGMATAAQRDAEKEERDRKVVELYFERGILNYAKCFKRTFNQAKNQIGAGLSSRPVEAPP